MLATQPFPDQVAAALRQRADGIEVRWREALASRTEGRGERLVPVHALAGRTPELLNALAETVGTGQLPAQKPWAPALQRLAALRGPELQGPELVHPFQDAVGEVVVAQIQSARPEPAAVYPVYQRIGRFMLVMAAAVGGAALSPVQQALREAAAVDRFSRALNHELRNHAYALQMQVRLLREPRFAQDEARRLQLLDRMKAALSEMGQASERVIAAAQGPHPEASPVAPLDEAVAELQADLEAFTSASGVALQVDPLPATPLPVEPIQRALTELVINAVKFRDRANQTPKIQIQGAVDGSTVRLEVQDDGPGIPPALGQSVFVHGVRGTHPEIAGEGHGLWEVRQLLVGLGGEVALQPGPQGGCRVVLSVPLP